MFVDTAQVKIEAGDGGRGITSFRHEKFVSRGGPDGGNGGKGGDVILRGSTNQNTLSKFRNSKLIKAQSGESGGKRKKQGKSGDDKIIEVPIGTVATVNGQVIADITEEDEEVTIAKGGRGGFGNAHFKSSTRQAPRVAELGEPGEKLEVQLEIKMVADVGIIGLPNAGKSTLLSVISNAKPDIAGYPFTTLAPNLGVVEVDDGSYLYADIPGLIEGASKGKGLGDDFLRHIERTSVLLHLIDANEADVKANYLTIRGELENYEVDLTTKPQVVALTKIEALDKDEIKEKQGELEDLLDEPVFAISAVAHKGVSPLVRKIAQVVDEHKLTDIKDEPEESKYVFTVKDDPDAWYVEKENSKFIIYGQKIERLAKQTDFSDYHSMNRLRDILSKMGIVRELIKRDIKSDDKVQIADKQFEW